MGDRRRDRRRVSAWRSSPGCCGAREEDARSRCRTLGPAALAPPARRARESSGGGGARRPRTSPSRRRRRPVATTPAARGAQPGRVAASPSRPASPVDPTPAPRAAAERSAPAPIIAWAESLDLSHLTPEDETRLGNAIHRILMNHIQPLRRRRPERTGRERAAPGDAEELHDHGHGFRRRERLLASGGIHLREPRADRHVRHRRGLRPGVRPRARGRPPGAQARADERQGGSGRGEEAGQGHLESVLDPDRHRLPGCRRSSRPIPGSSSGCPRPTTRSASCWRSCGNSRTTRGATTSRTAANGRVREFPLVENHYRAHPAAATRLGRLEQVFATPAAESAVEMADDGGRRAPLPGPTAFSSLSARPWGS